MGGSVYIAIKRYAGVDLIDGIINVEPDVPMKWKHIHFKIKYKDIWYFFEIEKKLITVKLTSTRKKPREYREKLIIRKKEYLFELDKKHIICLKRNGEING